MWFQKKEIETQYVIVAEFERTTVNPILNERVAILKDLLAEGYKIVSAAGSLDGTVHYVLTRSVKKDSKA